MTTTIKLAMHSIEPFYNWRDRYTAEEDKYSPFYKREYSEFHFSNTIYNYYIHPQWDTIGSPSLFIKVLFADYTNEFAVIEMMGEWNDCLNNDIMFLKRDFVDKLILNGINKFILIGENILNFHASDDCYYEEWWEDISEMGGWIAAVNFRQHVLQEMKSVNLQYYLMSGAGMQDINWRGLEPEGLFELVDQWVIKAIE